VTSAAPFIPQKPTLPELRAAAAGCTGWELYRRATRTVFGEGPPNARVLLVGEQPGHEEDLAVPSWARPGGCSTRRWPRRASTGGGCTSRTSSSTFKWEPRGKRRIHAKPNAAEIAACRPWLDAEIALVRPEVLVCLGATAAPALFGRAFRVSRDRGRPVPSPLAPFVTATVHPSSLWRAPDDETRRRETRRFIDALQTVARVL
jgi:DNA polymerase